MMQSARGQQPGTLFRVYKYINHDKGIIYNWVYGLYTEYEIPFRVHKWLFLSNRG